MPAEGPPDLLSNTRVSAENHRQHHYRRTLVTGQQQAAGADAKFGTARQYGTQGSSPGWASRRVTSRPVSR